MRILGINAIYHDPSAALVVDGAVVAAAEEERFSRRKHGKRPVPFSAWELPELSMRWVLEAGGIRPEDVDVVAYSFDPALSKSAEDLGLHDPWDHLRTTYAEHVAGFLHSTLPGIDEGKLRYVPHHVAHAASAALASPFPASSVLVLDGRGERASHLAGRYEHGRIEVFTTQE
ncbi:MAG: carbamoyltransferase, partial [Cellulomonas sp. 14-74-6]